MYTRSLTHVVYHKLPGMESARRVSSHSSTRLPAQDAQMSGALSLGLLPDSLRQRACPVLCVFPHAPPVRGVDFPDALLQTPVPPVFRHLHQPDRDDSRRRFGLRLFGFVEVGKDLALLPQERGLLHAVLRVHRDGEVEDAGGEGHASELGGH
jgi:hypothetical protein